MTPKTDSTMEKQRVLFLCTGNSCRSQMAEGLLRELAGEQHEALSAGAKPSGHVHPHSITVMDELGIDISQQRSKSIHDFLPPAGLPPNLIVSVCDSAAENCPLFPGNVQHVQMPFEDPAHATGTVEDRLAMFRKIRDEIRSAIIETFIPS